MKKKTSIKFRILRLVLIVSLISVGIVGSVSIKAVLSVRDSVLTNLMNLVSEVGDDTTGALIEQAEERLKDTAENKGAIADTSLQLILNQTREVAMAAHDIYSDPDTYIEGRSADSLPLDAYDFPCNYSPETIGNFSFQIKAPRTVMKDESITEDSEGNVVSAELDPSKLSAEEKEELYLAGFLKSAIGGVRNFDNGDGTYNGIGASYFCLDSSGIDVLADTLTTPMVEYDARQSTWYKEASALEEGEIYWTNPVMDGAGRGVALICAMPVYVDGKLVGVAGSGGLIDNIRLLVQSTTIGESGYGFLINRDGPDGAMNLIANADKDEQSEINRFSDDLQKTDNDELNDLMASIKTGEPGLKEIKLNGMVSFVAYYPLTLTNWDIVTVLPADDATLTEPVDTVLTSMYDAADRTAEDAARSIRIMTLAIAVIVIIMIIVILIVAVKVSDKVTRPIQKLTKGVKTIGEGDLDTKIEVRSNDEVEELADGFNAMTDNLKNYIENLANVTAEKERIGAELNVATSIQKSMLPMIFPAFPDREDIDIFASMDAAKEVGGDFYDFFFVDETHFAIVVADVSGKGVPAALFMAIGKTLLKDHTNPGESLGKVFSDVNNMLCQTNSEQLFITAYEAILDISTGEVEYANAGHEHPFIMRKQEDGSYKYEEMKIKAGFVLAGMEDIPYTSSTFHMEPGDRLVQYTDGVTEATNSDNELYGMERLSAFLNSHTDLKPEELLPALRKDIDAFVGSAPQFDDITMLCLEYKKQSG